MKLKRWQHQIYLKNIRSQSLTAIFIVSSLLQTSISTSAQQSEKNSVRPVINNQASYTYTDPDSNSQYQGISTQLKATPGLIDPLGRILGCGGETLSDYTGFSMSLYEPSPNDPTGTELGRLVNLTRTELPDIPNNNIFGGKAPNIENSNPYFLQNNPNDEKLRGTYNFLLDPSKGQVEPGKVYILVVSPPANSIYKQRRIKIEIVGTVPGANNSNSPQSRVLRYIATSLDGQPIRLTGETRFEGTIVAVEDAELQGLDLLTFEFGTNLCQASQVQILKSGDRATAEPGDTVIYRLSMKNLADTALNNLVITDNLPLGFKFLPKSLRGEIAGKPVNLISEFQGSILTFKSDTSIPPGEVLNIAYATQLTNDSLRGTGRNTAIVNGQRADNGFRTKDGPATHQLQIRPGITADCGTIIGRVFVDKNFDGEQQENEPGIPNAVIFMENGNRISTDPNGLFSVANVLPGNHTGALDLSSLPGYTLAPNRKFKERNSQSRLVRLQPGGLVRMNFAVTPTFGQEVKK
ncbi:MAG: DUF11 domain-containing protein [Scytonematopsis contorta HA4267-MV1]|nr:DUF11 domain-containing protein [Scytonematopsis contorta HA4267-MV1]